MLGRQTFRTLKAALRDLPSHADAWRYSWDKDGLRFIVRALKELPAQPSPDSKLLVFFAHHDPQDQVDEYVRYYLAQLHALGSTVLFVSGSPNLTSEAVRSIAPYCAGIYTRRTLALDFGSWHLGWCILQSRGWMQHFDRLLMANDSVYGPLFDLGELFSRFTGADMYGASENLEMTRHLQSFFLLWELNHRTLPFLEEFWKQFRYTVNKDKLVARCEVGISQLARDRGLTMKPFISAEAAQELVRGDLPRQYADLLLQGNNSYVVYYWDGLIERARFPFLKTSLLRRNPWGSQTVPHWRSLLERSTTYPTRLIEENLRRLSEGPNRMSD